MEGMHTDVRVLKSAHISQFGYVFLILGFYLRQHKKKTIKVPYY